MNILQAVILSIVEGVTEFLPVSSTGHLILVSKLLSISQTEFVKSFEITIQLGAIAAVAWMYKTEIITNRKIWPKILTAFVPTAVLGLVFYKVIKTYLLGSTSVVLWALAAGGALLILLEFIISKLKIDFKLKIENLKLWQAFGVGLAQTVSMIPGVSRSAATIVGGGERDCHGRKR